MHSLDTDGSEAIDALFVWGEVLEGFECGVSLEGRNDVIEGDLIEAVEIVETARTL